MAEKEIKSTEKVEKKAKAAKPSLISRISAWFRSLRSEAKKVSWASAAAVRKNSIIVIVSVIVLSAVLGITDYLLSGAVVGLSRIF